MRRVEEYEQLASTIQQGTQKPELREFIAPGWRPGLRNTDRGILIEVPMVRGFTCVIDVLFCRSKTRLRNSIRGQKIVWRIYASIKDAVQDIATGAINALRIACEFVKRQIMKQQHLHGYHNSRQVRYRKFQHRPFSYAH